MIGLDTNVLTRYLAQDDLEQSRKADIVFQSLTSDEPGWISIAALVELVWVFTSKFHADRASVCRILDALMNREDILLENSETLHRALDLYRLGRADFADYVISCSCQAAGCVKTLTFDLDAAKTAGMTLIP